MQTWQADFYRRPRQNEAGESLWELLICDATRTLTFRAWCPQSAANADWLTVQLQQAVEVNSTLPAQLQCFRPQCLSLFEAACQPLQIDVVPSRRTSALKQWLQERTQQYPQMEGYTGESYQPLALDRPPPMPLPETLLGEQWRFATLPAGELAAAFAERPIPILAMPDDLLPMQLQLASTLPIPGVIIDGGRQSMQLARWLEEAMPVSLHYSPGQPDGLILEAGLVDRWVMATFEDPEVAAAARVYQYRQQESRGLHFLLVQPDDSGMTYSGFWLLQ